MSTENKNKQTSIVIIITIILLIIVIILIIWRIIVTERSSNGQTGFECNIDNDCNGTSKCEDGFCVPECSSSNDCPDRWTCINGSCSPECVLSADCSPDWTCINGTCTPQCNNDSDCSMGQTCNNGRCQVIVLGCEIVDVPSGVQAMATAADEITLTWNQALNASGYIAYISNIPGFIVGQELTSQVVLEPTRAATFTGLGAGTYYLKVVSTNNICAGTAFSSELTVSI